MVKELHLSDTPNTAVKQQRHSEKSKKPAPVVENRPGQHSNFKHPLMKNMSSTNSKSKEKKPVKKPVIAFYKNSPKSGWQLFDKVCFNEDQAKDRIRVMSGSEIVKCIDVPEELQNG